MRRQILVLALCGVVAGASAQARRELVTASDLLKIEQLGNVTVAPSGRYVAYTVRSIVGDSADAYRYRSQIWITSASGSEVPWQLTRGEASASAPAWRSDSEHLLFLRQADGTQQLFEISIYGGEAKQLTHFEHGVGAPTLSPNGELVLFATTLSAEETTEWTGAGPVWSDERPGRRTGDAARGDPDPDGSLADVRAWLAANREESNPRVFTRLNLQGELQLSTAPSHRHYFIADLSESPDLQMRMVTSGHYGYGDAAWLPDSRQIVVSGYSTESGHPDRQRDRDLYLVDVVSGRQQRLLDIEGYRLGGPQVSPNGSHITFTASDLKDPGYTQTELGLFALDGRSAPEMITLDFDRSVRSVHWAHDGWSVYFTAPSEGGVPLFRASVIDAMPQPTPATPEDTTAVEADSLEVIARESFLREELIHRGVGVTQLTATDRGIGSFDLTAATAYMVVTEVLNPFELYASSMDFENPRRLTSHNQSWLVNKRLSFPTAYSLQKDTLAVPYWIMPPTAQQPGQTYPLMVAIHGGPASMWGPGEATMWHEFQFFAAQGYGIVYSNPRGSGGYGRAWRRGNYTDWGDGPASDVLDAASETARRTSWVNADRQVVTGGSYAGYLTAWIVSQDNRFKAAVAQRGVYDLSTFFGEGNAWRLVPNHFGGYPWEIGVLLRANSPITFVDQIQTPLLIMHADNDLRTGVIQSEVLYKSLKVLDRPVEYVRYPDAGHDLSRTGNPTQRMDRLLRIWEFMERYVGS